MLRISIASITRLTACVAAVALFTPAGAAPKETPTKKPAAKTTAKPAAGGSEKKSTAKTAPAKPSKPVAKTDDKPAAKPASKPAPKTVAKAEAKPAARKPSPKDDDDAPKKKSVASDRKSDAPGSKERSSRVTDAEAKGKKPAAKTDAKPERKTEPKPEAKVADAKAKPAGKPATPERKEKEPAAPVKSLAGGPAKVTEPAPARVKLEPELRTAGEPERPEVDVPELPPQTGVLGGGTDEAAESVPMVVMGAAAGSAMRLAVGLEPTVDVNLPASITAMPPVVVSSGSAAAATAGTSADVPPAPDEPALFGAAEPVVASVRERAGAIAEASGEGAAVRSSTLASAESAPAPRKSPAAPSKGRVEPAPAPKAGKLDTGSILAAAKAALPAAAAVFPPALEPTAADELAPKPAAGTKPGADPFAGQGLMGDLMIAANSQTDFDTDQNRVVFNGNVVMKNSRFYLTSDKLVVYMKPNHGGLDFAEAQGNVTVKLVEEGRETGAAGQSNLAVYHPTTGEIKLRGWPKLRFNNKAHIASSATTEMSLYTDGRMKTSGRNQTLFVPDAAGAAVAAPTAAPR